MFSSSSSVSKAVDGGVPSEATPHEANFGMCCVMVMLASSARRPSSRWKRRAEALILKPKGSNRFRGGASVALVYSPDGGQKRRGDGVEPSTRRSARLSRPVEHRCPPPSVEVPSVGVEPTNNHPILTRAALPVCLRGREKSADGGSRTHRRSLPPQGSGFASLPTSAKKSCITKERARGVRGGGIQFMMPSSGEKPRRRA